jgi:hypothetical protein
MLHTPTMQGISPPFSRRNDTPGYPDRLISSPSNSRKMAIMVA